ncbi:hypothetical protein [Streptomyces sp. NPDC054958]
MGGARRRRALIAALARRAARPASVAELVADVRGDDPPHDAPAARAREAAARAREECHRAPAEADRFTVPAQLTAGLATIDAVVTGREQGPAAGSDPGSGPRSPSPSTPTAVFSGS